MKLIKLLISLLLLSMAYTGIHAQDNDHLTDSQLVKIQVNDQLFYLINADSSKMKELFAVDEHEAFYLLVFSWKYRINKAELYYSDSISTNIKAQFSKRTPFVFNLI